MNASPAPISRPRGLPERRVQLANPCAWVAALSLAACSDGAGPRAEPQPLRFTAITVAVAASCALTADGAAYCWGDGREEQLGTASPPEQCAAGPCSTRPVRVESATPLTGLSANDWYVCGLDPAGSPLCWGWIVVDVDAVHQFGPKPVPLPNGVALTSISAGGSHICGVATDHQAYCWGDFEGGRRGYPLIGFDTSYATFQPNVVGGGLQFAEVRAGSWGTCGLTVGGQAYCWGSNVAGTLGDPAATVQQNCGLAPQPCALAPVPVAGSHLFTSLSGSRLHVCGATASGDLYCWGSDVAHQIGVPDPSGTCAETPCEAAPAKVFATDVTFAAVSAGGLSTCGLTGDGIAYCWGDDSYGQLGISGGSADLPVQVAGGHRLKAIAVAIDHACALLLDGDAFCWGENGSGQLGTGDRKDSNEPVAVAAPAAD